MIGVKVARAGETCAGTSPYVCVERADLNDPPPVEGQDFSFDVFTDPAMPDVTFKTGSSTPWRVWSQVSVSDTTPANLGDLFIDSSGSTDNYTVEILNPNECSGGVCNAGAANLKTGSDATGNMVIGGDNNGRVTIGADLDGDVRINGDSTYQIWVVNSLLGNGRILIDGVIGGQPLSRVIIGDGTVGGSLIRATGGIVPGATVFVNLNGGDFDARGSMYFGDASPFMPVATTFDGNVMIQESFSGGFGRLFGALTVRGCHATADLLDICICGSGSPRSPLILQNGCPTQIPAPFWNCQSTCP